MRGTKNDSAGNLGAVVFYGKPKQKRSLTAPVFHGAQTATRTLDPHHVTMVL